jgi:hypothetical protein
VSKVQLSFIQAIASLLDGVRADEIVLLNIRSARTSDARVRHLLNSPILVPRVLAVEDNSGESIVVDVGVYSAIFDSVKSTGVAGALQGISDQPTSFVAAFSQALTQFNLTLPIGFGVGTPAPTAFPTTTPTLLPTRMALVREALKDLQEEEEVEEAVAAVGDVASTAVATSVAASVGGAVVSSVSASVAASAAGAAGAGAGAGTAAGAGASGAGAGAGGAGGGAAVVLIFALQKLAVVSRIDMLDEKMPVVTALGKEFEWVNMMAEPPWLWGLNRNGSNVSDSSTNSNRTVNGTASSARQRRRRNLLQAHGIDNLAASERPRNRGGIAAISALVRIGSIGAGRLHRWWVGGRRVELGIEQQRRLLQEGLVFVSDSNGTNTTNSSTSSEGSGCAAEILTRVEKAQSDTTLDVDLNVPVPIDTEGVLVAKFEGNIFWGMIIVVLTSVLHLALHRCIMVPHKQRLNLHVMDHWSAILGRHAGQQTHPSPPPYQRLEFCFHPPASSTAGSAMMDQALPLGIGVVIKPATIFWQGTVCYDPDGVCSRGAAEVVRVRASGQAETMVNSTVRVKGRALCGVEEGPCAEVKGLQRGDFIIEIMSEPTNSSNGSIDRARQQLADFCLPGNTRKVLTMVVLRGTEEHIHHEMSVGVALGKIHPPIERDYSQHHSVRDITHGSVLAAHHAVHLADPLMYKIGEAVVGLLKENKFPKPELMVLAMLYQVSRLQVQ